MLICYLAIGISQFAIAMTSLDEIFADGEVKIHAISLLSGITFSCIAAIMLLHDRRAKAEDEDE